ncbi:MAG: mitofilin family membrane protein [Pseudomonadota bacterium]
MTGPTDDDKKPTDDETPIDAAEAGKGEAGAGEPETVEAEIVEDADPVLAASDADETIDAEAVDADADAEDPDPAVAAAANAAGGSASGTNAGFYTLGFFAFALAIAVAFSLTTPDDRDEPIRMANATEADYAAGRDTEAFVDDVATPLADESETEAEAVNEPAADEAAAVEPVAAEAEADAAPAAVEEVAVDEEEAVETIDVETAEATEDEAAPDAEAAPADAENAAVAEEQSEPAPEAAEDAAPTDAIAQQSDDVSENDQNAVEDKQTDEEQAEDDAPPAAEQPVEDAAPAAPRTDPLVQARIERLEAQLAEAQSRADQALALAQEDPEADAEVEALQGRVAELSSRIEELRGGVATTTRLENDLSSLKAELLLETQAATQAAEAAVREAQSSRNSLAADREAISRQLQEIERLRSEVRSTIESRDDSARQELQSLRQRIDRIQTEEVAAASKTAATSLALLNLQRQVTQGRPFANELSAVRGLSPNLAPLAQLQPYARDGLPSVAYLERTFPEAARAAQTAAKRAGAEGGVSGLVANFMSLVTVRKAGDVPGETPGAILSRAEARLEENDLKAAVEELEGLKGEAADAMDEWLAAARARVAVDDLMDDVSAEVVGDLGDR